MLHTTLFSQQTNKKTRETVTATTLVHNNLYLHTTCISINNPKLTLGHRAKGVTALSSSLQTFITM